MILSDMLKKWTLTKKIKDASKEPKVVAKNWCVLSFSKIFITGDFVVKNFIMRGEPTEKTKIKLAQNYHLRFCSP